MVRSLDPQFQMLSGADRAHFTLIDAAMSVDLVGPLVALWHGKPSCAVLA